MKKSRKVESKDHAGNLALIQQLNDLENIWKSLEKTRPRCLRTSSNTTSTTITSSNNLFQKSPRTLMSSLQRRKSDFGRVLRVKNCSDGVEEILMDRRSAIMSGRFKGRQLFGKEEYSGPSDSCSGVNGIREREVIMNYDGSRGRRGDQHELLPEDKVVVEVANVAEKRGGDWRRKEKGSGFMLATVCLALVLLFFSMRCNGKYMQELILVPT